jgi:hypothetical protein
MTTADSGLLLTSRIKDGFFFMFVGCEWGLAMSPLFGCLIDSNLNIRCGNGEQVVIPNGDDGIGIGSRFDFAPTVSGTKTVGRRSGYASRQTILVTFGSFKSRLSQA